MKVRGLAAILALGAVACAERPAFPPGDAGAGGAGGGADAGGSAGTAGDGAAESDGAAKLPAPTACPSPILPGMYLPGVPLLDDTSLLTDAVGLGDRWIVAWTDRRGRPTAKVAAITLDGAVIATRELGSPMLEPRLAAAGDRVGVTALSASDPNRRDFQFFIFDRGLAPVTGSQTLPYVGATDGSRAALAWNGEVFGLYPGREQVILVVQADGSFMTFRVSVEPVPSGRPLVGVPGGFALLTTRPGVLRIKTLSAIDGQELSYFDMATDATAGSLAIDPTTGRLMGAAAGQRIQLFDDTGAARDLTMGGDLVDFLGLGVAGGPLTTVVAISERSESGARYHLSGVHASGTYGKTDFSSGGASRLRLAAAGDSVGLFLSSDAGGTISNRYFRIRCP